MRFVGLAYRGHNPKWSFAPTSGEGAAVHGGRFNPKGIPALYLATSPEGAFLEATQGFAYKFSPLTLCSYEVDCKDIVDLTTQAARANAGVTLDEMAAPWAWDISEGRKPASWQVHARLHATAAGICVPSFARDARPGMTNLVLWTWGDSLPHKAVVFDPDHRLPERPRT